jgi:hypothetical protein
MVVFLVSTYLLYLISLTEEEIIYSRKNKLYDEALKWATELRVLVGDLEV